jgi:hypothetical protein
MPLLSLPSMLDDVRNYVRSRIGDMGARRAEDVATEVISRAQDVAEQFSAFAAGFLQWSAEARRSLLQEVREVVARQVQDMGLATKKDLDALVRRMDRFEERMTGDAGGSRSSRRAPSKRASSSSSRAPSKRASSSSSRAPSKRASSSSSSSGSARTASTTGRRRSRTSGRSTPG